LREKGLNQFIKFAVVGGTGALINFFFTYVLTEGAHLWYMLSLVLATFIAMLWNFYFNKYWVFVNQKSADDSDYDYYAFYNGNPLQKWWKQQIAQKVAAMVEGENILDFGCGSSPICNMLNGQHYYGLDGNEDKINFMNRFGLANRKFAHVTFENFKMKGIMDCLPEYDTTMTIEVIEHMPNKQNAQMLLNCLSRATCKGGVVVIATPNYDSKLWIIIEKLYGLLMDKAYAYDHITHFNEYSLIQMAQRAGLVHEVTSTILGADMICKFRKVQDVILV
jgi:2-polyprenyl-3-methyl-5-hydroxy-6-metoxy-1,4-benzoquinol methylase